MFYEQRSLHPCLVYLGGSGAAGRLWPVGLAGVGGWEGRVLAHLHARNCRLPLCAEPKTMINNEGGGS